MQNVIIGNQVLVPVHCGLSPKCPSVCMTWDSSFPLFFPTTCDKIMPWSICFCGIILVLFLPKNSWYVSLHLSFFFSNLTFTEVFVYLIEPAFGVLLSLSSLYFVHPRLSPSCPCSQQGFLVFLPRLTIYFKEGSLSLGMLPNYLRRNPSDVSRAAGPAAGVGAHKDLKIHVACILIWLPALAVATCSLPLGLARRDRISE